MVNQNLRIIDITCTHSQAIPYLFHTARDLKTTPALYAVVHDESPANPLGYALLASPLGSERIAYQFDIRMLEEKHCPGADDKLVAHVLYTAQRLRAPALQILTPVSNDDCHQQLLERHQFRSIRRTLTYKFGLNGAFAIFKDKVECLQAAGRIPEQIDAIPYSTAAYADELSAHCNAAFGLLTHGHLRALGHYPAEGQDYSYSTQIRAMGQLVGAWGIGIHGDTATFDPLLIATPYRNTWGFAYVIHNSLRRLLAAGVTGGIAQIHETNTKMHALMKRIGADSTDIEHLYEFSFQYLDGERL